PAVRRDDEVVPAIAGIEERRAAAPAAAAPGGGQQENVPADQSAAEQAIQGGVHREQVQLPGDGLPGGPCCRLHCLNVYNILNVRSILFTPSFGKSQAAGSVGRAPHTTRLTRPARCAY